MEKHIIKPPNSLLILCFFFSCFYNTSIYVITISLFDLTSALDYLFLAIFNIKGILANE